MASKTKTLSKWIEIDLSQFRRNIDLIKNYVDPALLCMPVKANAYGHGLTEMAKASDSIDYYCVSHVDEGVSLRESGIRKPILVLGAFIEEEIERLIDHNLEFSLSSFYKLNLVEKYLSTRASKAYVHLKIETGMQRVGVRPETAIKLYNQVNSSSKIILKGIYSHLAHSYAQNPEAVLRQVEIFTNVLKQIKSQNLLVHLLNSANVIHNNLPKFDMVRPGLLALGYGFSGLPSQLKEISPCFSLKSRVTYFKVVPPKSGVSYGHQYKTSRQSRFVTIPIGYGDGYRREMSNKADVLIRGKRYPIRGHICMDQMMVEIGNGQAYVGDEVVLIGKQGSEEITLSEIAKLSRTIEHEMLCSFNLRLPRIYKEQPIEANFS